MNKPADHIGSLAKGLRVLEAFGADTPILSITEAARITGLDRATTRRCLLTLHHEGYADYDGKYFTLSHKALRLGQSALDALPMPQIVQPWLDQLTETIGQTCSVGVLDGTEILYLARAAQKRVMSIGLMPGSRLPAYCTAMGRVLLAHLPKTDAREVVMASDLTPRTVHSLTQPTEILAHIATAKAAGYALVDQEIELGLRSLAVPLYDGAGKVVAGLNTGLAAVHADANEVVADYLPHLLRVQKGLSRSL